jgi:hypothetical protein
MGHGYGGWAPYEPVAERRRKAAREMERLRKAGHPVSPVAVEGRKIATSFWGKAWCDNLESYSDYANRLPRGRTYVRNGSVIDLQIGPREVKAKVSGSQIYSVKITIEALPAAIWKAICAAARAASSPWWNSCAAACRRRSWTASAAGETGCFQSRAGSDFPAAARIPPRCANMSRRRFMVWGRVSTPSRNWCSGCARSTPARSSRISTRPCRHRAAAREGGLRPPIFRISLASTWRHRRRQWPPKPRNRRSRRRR